MKSIKPCHDSSIYSAMKLPHGQNVTPINTEQMLSGFITNIYYKPKICPVSKLASSFRICFLDKK